ncbi:hypothetical protein [Streptomyces sp. B21-083]|uniref:hypothetical protein n=1 Tax=Streptomyces sp. B21-083 TaxID=3039410 RepID=UPI002FF278E4
MITPFVLVIDQMPKDDAAFEALRCDLGFATAQQTGARAVLVFEDTIDIPANETPVDPDGYPLKIRVEPDFETFRQQVQEEILAAQGKITTALKTSTPEAEGPTCRYCGADCIDGRSWDGGDLYACPACSDWRAKLNQQKAAITDALGMDRTRDWDDIRNAARGLRKERGAQAEALERVRNLHRPVDHRGSAICGECSAYAGSSTDNAPVAHDQCGTLRALVTDRPAPDA